LVVTAIPAILNDWDAAITGVPFDVEHLPTVPRDEAEEPISDGFDAELLFLRAVPSR